MNLTELSKDAYKIAQLRNQVKQTDSVVSSVKYLAGEMIELTEAASENFVKPNPENLNHLSEELADVIICACSIAAQCGVNIEKAVSDKMIKNLDRAYNNTK